MNLSLTIEYLKKTCWLSNKKLNKKDLPNQNKKKNFQKAYNASGY